VIAQQADRASFTRQPHAGVRLGAVADDISETPDLLKIGTVDVSQYGLEGRKVCVDVRDHSNAHGWNGVSDPPRTSPSWEERLDPYRRESDGQACKWQIE